MNVPPDDNSNKQRNLLIAGGVGVAIAVVLFATSIGDNGSGNKGRAEFSCKIGVAGMTAITQGVTRGNSVSGILLTVGTPIAANEACKQAIATWVREPEEPAEIELATPTGTTTETITGNDLNSPVQEPTTTGYLAIDCLGWTTLLYQLCLDGDWPTYPR